MIQINLFTAHGSHYKDRFWFTKLSLDQFSKIKKTNLDKISLHIYINKDEEDKWVSELTNPKYSNVDIVIQCMNDDDYITKVKLAQQTESKYSCKWDDDVFINSYIWDYMIENINILDEKNVSAFIPTIQNGIPTVDFFIEDFLDKKDTEYVHSIFLEEGIKKNIGIWGCDYSKVQKYIESNDKWNYQEYWNFIDKFNPIENIRLPRYMELAKAVHPARFSYTYNKFICDKLIKNTDMMFNKKDYNMMHHNTVYFCNNLTFVKTDFWIESLPVFTDGWDEGQMNVYSLSKNMHPVYVRNACGVHMAYGCTEGQKIIEETYINELCKPFFSA